MKTNLKISFLVLISFLPCYKLISQIDSFATFTYIEEMPLFNGGDPLITFREYLQEQVKTRYLNITDSIKGRIIIQFLVDSSGHVVKPLIVMDLDKAIDSLACVIVQSSPKWTPGKQRGENIAIPYTFPIFINIESPVNKRYNNKKKNKQK